MNRLVCEQKCSEYKPGEYVECPHYSDWYYEYYGKDVEVPEPKRKMGKKKNVD